MCLLYLYQISKKGRFIWALVVLILALWGRGCRCVHSDNRSCFIGGGCADFARAAAAALWRFGFGVILNYADPAAWWAVAFGLCRRWLRLRSAAAAAFFVRSLLELVRLPFFPCV